MKDKIFIDTNIWIYFWLNDDTNKVTDKNKFVVNFLDRVQKENTIVSSLQIFNELSNVFLKKYKLPSDTVEYYLNFINDLVDIVHMEYADILKAIKMREKYVLSYYDSLMIQSALNSNCTILYSEDLSHNQIFEKRLKVINPFIQ